MPKKPPSISFKPAGQNKPCTTIINGDLKVKGDLITNGGNNGGSSRVYLDPETVDEDNKTYSLDTTLSFVTYDGPNGQGNIPPGDSDGLLKYVIDLVDERVDCLGDCIDGKIFAIAYDNGGNGPYIGGEFKNAGRVEGLNYLAKWGGTSVGWTSVDSSGDNVNNTVYAIEFDSSNNVYIGGSFTSVSGNTVLKKLAKYDGSWGVINTSNSTPDDKISGNAVYTISFDNSNEIYIGGDFSMLSGPPFFASYNNIAKWDGSSVEWSAINSSNPTAFDNILGGSVLTVKAITSNEIYIGGEFTSVDEPPNSALQFLAKWNGSIWGPIDTSVGIDNIFGILRIINVVNSNEIYIGGDFTDVGGTIELDKIAKWNGSSWTSINGSNDNVNESVYSITLDSSNNVYIGGNFTSVDNKSNLQHLAKWNGSSWTSVNSGGDNVNNIVWSIVVGPSNNVTIGGEFTEPLEYLATTDQTTGWTSFDTLDNSQYTLTYNSGETAVLTGLSNNSYLKLIWSSHLNKWIQVP